MRLLPLGLLALLACGSPGPSIPDAWDLSGQTRANHLGPLVAVGKSGPQRFVPALVANYDAERAFELCAALDQHYREPGNDGFNAALDLVRAHLEAAGFGRREGFLLREIESELPGPAWTPLSAQVVMHAGGREDVLHSFTNRADHDRCVLPVHAVSADLRGPVVFAVEDLQPGSVLVTDKSLRRVLPDAQKAGAALVLSAYLQDICVDPTGKERHHDAIAYSSVRRGTELPVGQISPRSLQALRDAGAGVEVSYRSAVRWDERPLRTLVAEVVGVLKPEEMVTIVAHVDEPGACDNATGAAGLAEAARALAVGVERGAYLRPQRSMAFVWGEEYRSTQIFLEDSARRPIAGFSSDMTGTDAEQTGATCLLERGWDPGALVTLPPDEHTPWGAGRVDASQLVPHGLNVIMRTALVDVGLHRRPWRTREHPWEGGSDHDIFLSQGLPGVLLWHFTDFAYHTSLDRMEHVDAEELMRTSVALGAAGLAVADARPDDLERYLRSLLLERRLRLNMVEQEQAGDELAQQWEDWFTGARHWLRRLCLGLDADDQPPAAR